MSDRPIYVSVVVPLYNKEAFIAQTLSSIQAQNHQQFEVVVVDDGSTDNWQEAVAPFRSDSRFRFVEQVNSGVSAARNRGVAVASYPLVSFLDADDYWSPDFLSKMLALHKEHPGFDAYCAGRSYVVGCKTTRYVNRAVPADGEKGNVDYVKNIALGNPAINSSNNLIKKSLLVSQPFNQAMRRFEDHELWMRLFHDNKIMMWNLPLSFYRKASLRGTPLQPKDFPSVELYLGTIDAAYKSITGSGRFWLRYFFTSFSAYHLMKNKVLRNQIYVLFRPYMPMVFPPVKWYLNLICRGSG